MSETLTKVVVDCATGDVTVVPLTAAEIQEREQMAAQAEAERQAREAEEAAKEAARLSAEQKLAALGLSAEEIAALKG